MATKGMDRLLISISNLERSLVFYRDLMGMKVVAEETLEPDEIQQLWNLPQETEARAVYLKSELQSTLLALIEFNPRPRRTIRERLRSWDYGMYDVAFQVRDIDEAYHDLIGKGFTFLSPPIHYVPGWTPFAVKEAVVIGPDSVYCGYYEKIVPEQYERQYVKFDHLGTIVGSYKDVYKFYGDILGFDFTDEFIVPEGVGDDVMALPPGTEVKLTFALPPMAGTKQAVSEKKDVEALIEALAGETALVIEFIDLSVKGKSLASVGRPPNLGLFMMSFEVDDLSSLMETFKKEGIPILSGPVELHTKLSGKKRAITVDDTSGMMVELFER